jgi:hypothetical protein
MISKKIQMRIRGNTRYAPLRVTSSRRPLRGRGLVVPETLRSFFRQTLERQIYSITYVFDANNNKQLKSPFVHPGHHVDELWLLCIVVQQKHNCVCAIASGRRPNGEASHSE